MMGANRKRCVGHESGLLAGALLYPINDVMGYNRVETVHSLRN